MATSSPKTRVLAGIRVPDTPLLKSLVSFLKSYYDEMTWNHVNRSWLLGALIASKYVPLSSPISDSPPTFDPEIHAISALSHDLAWDCRKSGENFCSPDKRFEVDCAIGAIKVLKQLLVGLPANEQESWNPRKLQLIWDSIALHATPSIATYKESEVAMTSLGVTADFLAGNFPGGFITWAEWDEIVAEFPYIGKDYKEEFKEGAKRLLSALCVDKAGTTYDNFVGEFGDKFVEDFSLDGKRPSDMLLAPIVRE